MTSKEWRHHIRALAPVSRPDDVEDALLADFAAVEKERDAALQRVAEWESLMASWRDGTTSNTAGPA